LFGDLSLHFAKLPGDCQSIPEPCEEANNLPVESTSKSKSLTETLPAPQSNSRSDSETSIHVEVNNSGAARNDTLEAKRSCIESLANIPDSELSAKELHQKHNIIDDDDVAMRLARALLIKNYYTVETKVNQCKNEQTGDSKNGKILTADDIIVALEVEKKKITEDWPSLMQLELLQTAIARLKDEKWALLTTIEEMKLG
jgi:hypothetical protein